MGTAKRRRPARKPVAAKVKIAVVDVFEVMKAPEKPLRPSQCRGHLRKKLAEAYPAIVAGFVEQAKSGSCQHLKMATDLVEAKKAGRASMAKGPAARMLEEWEREGL
jgi:hypothetical protein